MHKPSIRQLIHSISTEATIKTWMVIIGYNWSQNQVEQKDFSLTPRESIFIGWYWHQIIFELVIF